MYGCEQTHGGINKALTSNAEVLPTQYPKHVEFAAKWQHRAVPVQWPALLTGHCSALCRYQITQLLRASTVSHHTSATMMFLCVLQELYRTWCWEDAAHTGLVSSGAWTNLPRDCPTAPLHLHPDRDVLQTAWWMSCTSLSPKSVVPPFRIMPNSKNPSSCRASDKLNKTKNPYQTKSKTNPQQWKKSNSNKNQPTTNKQTKATRTPQNKTKKT